MHKPYKFKRKKYYCPIQVNAKKNIHFLTVTDDLGNNISEKNDRFCELTALYWAWKNDSHSRYIGLCHYRRYFKMKFNFFDLLNTQYNQQILNDIDIDLSPKIINWLKKGYIILPKPLNLGKFNAKEQYEMCHDSYDLKILKEIFLNMYPEYTSRWNAFWRGHKLYTYNMFITNRDTYDKYMEWLFSILFAVEKEIPRKNDSYQNRTFGFMAERLLNIFFMGEKSKIKELPVIFLTE